MMKRPYLFSLLICLSLLFIVVPAHSEVLQTSPGVLQDSGKELKIIVSYPIPGVFILLGKPTELQLFDPAKVAIGDGLHAFVHYNPSLDRYDSIRVGEKLYTIKGNATFFTKQKEAALQFSVDNRNPYLSVLYERKGVEPSLVGFRGIETVVNEKGEGKVALLEANQLSQDYKGLIEPYELSQDGLLFKGKLLNSNSVGIELEPGKNECLGSEVVYIDKSEISKLKNAEDRASAINELEKSIANSSQEDPLKGTLLLRLEESLIALDYKRNRVKVIRSLKAGSEKGHPTKSPAVTYCVVESIKLS